tara:strand:- start:9601 stop:10260 length:660 start_codon:yes stop_codon:yes gene_type:complete
MEKAAFSLSGAGRAVGRGAKRVGQWAVKNPVEAALTASMFVPGMNVVGAGLRGASLLAKGGMAAYRARKAYQAAKGGTTALKSYRAARASGAPAQAAFKGLGASSGAASNMAKARNLASGAKSLRNQAGRTVRGGMPWNRAGAGSIGFGGSWTGGAKGVKSFSGLSRGGKALRVGGVGLAGGFGAQEAAKVTNIARTPARRATKGGDYLAILKGTAQPK